MNRREPNPDRAEPYALAGRGLSSRGGVGAVPRAHWLPAAMQQPVRRPQASAAPSTNPAQTVPVSTDAEAPQDDWWNDLVDLTAVMVESAEQSGALARMQAASEQGFGNLNASDGPRDGSPTSTKLNEANPSAFRGSANAYMPPNTDASVDSDRRSGASFAESASSQNISKDANERASDTAAHAFAHNATSTRGGLDSSLGQTIATTATPAARDSRAQALDDEARLAGRFAKRGPSATTTAQAASWAERAERSHLPPHGAEADSPGHTFDGVDAADAKASHEQTELSQHADSARTTVSTHRSTERLDDAAMNPSVRAMDRPNSYDQLAPGADALHADAAGRLSDRIDAMNARLNATRHDRDRTAADQVAVRATSIRRGEMGLPETAAPRPGPPATMAAPALDAASIAALLAPAPAASGPSISIDRVQVTVQAPASAKPAAAPVPTTPAARSAPAARGMGGAAGYRSPWASYFTRRD